jgi:hypothetical protein
MRNVFAPVMDVGSATLNAHVEYVCVVVVQDSAQ